MSLYDFIETEPIKVDERSAFLSPVSGEILGYSGPSNRGKALVSRKVREDHLYRKENAYPLDKVAVEKMSDRDIKVVIFQEKPSGNVFEFEISQFLNGEITSTLKGQPRVSVSNDNAKFKWTENEAEINAYNG